MPAFGPVTGRDLLATDQVDGEDVLVVHVIGVVDEADQLKVLTHPTQTLERVVDVVLVGQIREQAIEEHDPLSPL
ncbi:hypothetical protein GALL_468750 [mine drainage metagenome]|uniref:Uncharacterized protein n=1 Tax=mine drainage metagenome TaxID=410659 RepID=A0A1J5Q6D3_9ZZZZ